MARVYESTTKSFCNGWIVTGPDRMYFYSAVVLMFLPEVPFLVTVQPLYKTITIRNIQHEVFFAPHYPSFYRTNRQKEKDGSREMITLPNNNNNNNNSNNNNNNSNNNINSSINSTLSPNIGSLSTNSINDSSTNSLQSPRYPLDPTSPV
ncbi:hypothetical protein PPL_03584 [Heterostelium album PN500]|uniref:Uncharacterized protein n=1 Tax=Heterostelium pallidum (strain ATCC 26659 / Pp 5 / PN500) TaxID=670386 RepID=D3B572_HETP5|nr:hypothetical protein PPL_03584 [Heterostelium album PN500]EFA83437.1 hypothetical protein PPL_03584 [Heterostelium album PN500]|eukprot:XP_020435554.1 hypothetical protein PPL_03584 [Heterostelium album PN500]